MRLWREEVFGPVRSIARWSDYEEMLSLAGDTQHGFSATISNNDVLAALKTDHRSRASSIYMDGSNRHLPGMAWGGVKGSGIGHEEGGEKIMTYLEIQQLPCFYSEAARMPVYRDRECSAIRIADQLGLTAL